MLSRRLPSFTRPLGRGYASARVQPGGKWPRPKPGTSERPPYRAPDPLNNNPSATVTTLPDEDLTFIHRPPPTAPSPISYTTNPVSPLLKPASSPVSSALPPLLRPAEPLPLRLTEDQVREIRRLRALDPFKWTRSRLAKKFPCSQYFIGLVAATKKTTRTKLIKKRDEEHQENRGKWSERKSLVNAISQKRRQYW